VSCLYCEDAVDITIREKFRHKYKYISYEGHAQWHLLRVTEIYNFMGLVSPDPEWEIVTKEELHVKSIYRCPNCGRELC